MRNALGRFERVRFEDDAARERARRRLLNAAKKYGIVPVGFITGQLRSERTARTPDFSTYPTGIGHVPDDRHRGFDDAAARAG